MIASTEEQVITPDDLHMFTGTEQWYRHGFTRKFLYTDGVKYFADKAQAYWFLDIASTTLYALHSKSYFLKVELIVKDSKAQIIVTDGDLKQIYTQSINFTDCPEGTWEFFMIDDTEHSVMLVPSEY